MAYMIDKNVCVFCSLCSTVCLFGGVKCNEEGRYYEIDAEKCRNCGQCYSVCGAGAISKLAGQKKIVSVKIEAEKCIGCSICRRNCPAFAPEGVIKQPFVINEKKCLLCGLCAEKCPKKAIIVTYEE